MFTVHLLLCVSVPTRNNRVLACVIDRPVHTRTRTRSTHTTHTHIHHDHTCIAVVHTRILGSVAIRPRIAVTVLLRLTAVADLRVFHCLARL